MCLAVPGRIFAIDADRRVGRAEVFGIMRDVNLGMLDEVAAGDWVLIQTGFAVEKMDEAQARETLRLYDEMSKDFEDALSREGNP